jgi:hypothetical protein
MGDIRIHEERTFRKTPGVHFADISIVGSSNVDLVEHSDRAVSPPSALGMKRWYLHQYQTDHNRVIKGSRLFELYSPLFKHPHWYVYLDADTGALEIPPYTYHRSVSAVGGSILINHAVRDPMFDEKKEFSPHFAWLSGVHPPRYYNISPDEVDYFLVYGRIP